MSSVSSSGFIPSQLSLLIKELRSSRSSTGEDSSFGPSTAHPVPGSAVAASHGGGARFVGETHGALLQLQTQTGGESAGQPPSDSQTRKTPPAGTQTGLGPYATAEVPGTGQNLVSKV